MGLLVSVLAGAVGALVLRSVVKFCVNRWLSRRPVAEYDCGEDAADEDPAALRHGWGRRVVDTRASNAVAWEYSGDRPRGRNREHTIYGPYTNDFGCPGYFRVRYRIAGTGFEAGNRVAVVVDVLHAPFDLQRNHMVLGQRVIHERDLKPLYMGFDVVCYTSGTGVFEYRVRVVESAFDSARHQLRFDNIRIYPYFPIWEVF